MANSEYPREDHPEQAKSSEPTNGGETAKNGDNGGGVEINYEDFTAEKLWGQGGQPNGHQPLVTVQFFSDNVADAVDQVQKALVKAGKHIYQRGGRLVQALWDDHSEGNRKVHLTRFRVLDQDQLRYLLNKKKLVVFFKKVMVGRGEQRHAEFVGIAPPVMFLQTFLGAAHWEFPRAIGIANAPTLRPDGSVIDAMGFDKTTKLHAHWHPELVLPVIAKEPTKADAQAALQLYLDLLQEFPFKDQAEKEPSLDLSVAVAAIISAVLRGAFRHCPMILVLAHVSGTGKSYLADLVSNIVEGIDCSVITASDNKEEMEKRLGALLLEGVQTISLDNLSHDLKGDLLNQMCTQTNIRVRILGKSETPRCEWRGILFANGNNVRPVGDLIRRTLICNMDARVERPEERKFKFDAIEKVHANRGAYLAAAITIARAYLASKDKAQCKPLAGFGPWARVVREPLIWLGMADVVASQEQGRRDDPQRSAVRELLALWHKAFQLAPKMVTDLLKHATNLGWDDELNVLLRDQVPNARGEPDARRLGWWLKATEGQIHSLAVVEDGKKVTANFYLTVVRENEHHGGKTYKLVKQGG